MQTTGNTGASLLTRHLAGAIALYLAVVPAGFTQALGSADAVAVDSFKNQLLGIDFDAGTVTPRNTDNDELQKINSVELAPSRCASRVDAFVADLDGGEIRRYRNAQGDGDLVCDPASAHCPLEPNGLSRSTGNTLAVGDRGVRSRDAARVWLVGPEDCNSEAFPSPVLLDAAICVEVRNGRCHEADAVVDVEFVNRPVGGLETDSLLVLTSGPTALIYYPASRVACTLAGNCTDEPEGRTLLALTDRSDRRPSGLALLPGGAEALIAYDDGYIKNVLLSGGDATEGSTLFATGLDPNLAGIDAGYLDGAEVVIAARRPSGEIFKLDVTRSAGEPVGTVVAVVDDGEIQARDVAINSLQRAIADCPVLEGDGGPIRICEFPEIDLIFNGVPNVPQGYSATILQSRIICDNSDITVPRELPLSGLGFTGTLADLVVPENIVGLPVSPDCRALVVIEIGDDYDSGELPPPAWIEYEARLDKIFGDVGTCRENYGRIGYNPNNPDAVRGWPNGDPNLPGGFGDEFGDTTVGCFNPPRGMGRENSAIVIGASRGKTLWEEEPGFPTASDLAYIKSYALEQLGYLDTTLAQSLQNDPQFQSKLDNALDNILLAVNSAGTNGVTYDEAFAVGRDGCAAAAVLIAENRDRFTEAPEVGDLLSRFANCALFLEEEGRGGDWTPPYYGLAGQTPPVPPPTIP